MQESNPCGVSFWYLSGIEMVVQGVQPPALPGLSKRWALMALLFAGITLVYCLRVNLSVAVQVTT